MKSCEFGVQKSEARSQKQETWHLASLPRRQAGGIWYLVFAGILHLASCICLWAQTDLYPFPRVEEEPKIKKDRRKKNVDPFVQILSKKMGISETLAEEVMNKGFGRMEAIRLILLSKKSGKPLEEIAKMREQGTRFAKIAEECGQDNRTIKKEAEKISKELQNELEKIKQELLADTTSLAGTSDEILTKNSTGQFQKGKENGKSKPNP